MDTSAIGETIFVITARDCAEEVGSMEQAREKAAEIAEETDLEVLIAKVCARVKVTPAVYEIEDITKAQ